MKELSHLNKYLLKYRYRLLLGTIFIVIANFFAILPAQLIRNAFNLVKESIHSYQLFDGLHLQKTIYQVFVGGLVTYGVFILVAAIINGVFLFLVRQTILVMARRIEYDLKNEIYQHYQTLPLSFYRRNSTGDLMARISEDVNRVRMYLGPAIMFGLNLTILFLMVIPYMFTINVKLTLYSLIPLPILSVTIYYVSRSINQRSEKIQRKFSQLATFVQEAFSGIRILKSFAREAASVEKFTIVCNDYKEKALHLTRVNALFFPLMISMISLSTILNVFVGGVEVTKGAITPGNIAEFVIYMNLLSWPVTSVGWVTSLVQRAIASQKRINEFLSEQNPIVSQKALDKQIDGNIIFQNVSFTYPDSGIQAVQAVSFEVPAGESMAIIGTTGAGKSTIANLLCRLYDATAGKIILDGSLIQHYAVPSLRKQIGYVPQDVFLFSDTIKNNIAFGMDQATEEIITQAAKEADIYENIQRFPKKMETRLGERGVTLSGGQKQRLTIARALVRNPPILVLDDALSSVDTKTEQRILQKIKHVMKGKTMIIISHRVSVAQLANQILILDAGRVVEQGNHKSLLKNKGFYYTLHKKQRAQKETVE